MRSCVCFCIFSLTWLNICQGKNRVTPMYGGIVCVELRNSKTIIIALIIKFKRRARRICHDFLNI